MSHPGRTVLVVETDDAVRDSLRALLESCGWCCRAFDSGADLLAVCAPDYALLLVDADLPGRRCAELLRELSVRGIDLPAIAITPRDDALTRAHLLSMGARAVLVRPFDLQELSRAMSEAMTEPGRRDSSPDGAASAA